MTSPLVIAHMSDLHLSAVHRRENIRNTKRLLDYIGRLHVDHVVVTGDLTASGLEGDLHLARSIFAGHGLLDPRKMSVVPGNHDVFGGVHTAEEILDFPRRCKNTSVHRKVELFVEYFGELFRGTIGGSERHPFPYLKPLGGLLLVGMNSVAEYSAVKNPVGSNGGVDHKQQERLDRLLSSSPFKHLRKVVLIHHHFNKVQRDTDGTMHSVWQMIEQQTMKLRGKKALMDLFSKHGVSLVLHGHSHQNVEYARKGLRFVNGGGSILSPSPSSLHVNVVHISDAGVDVQQHDIPSLATSAQAPNLPPAVPVVPSQVAA